MAYTEVTLKAQVPAKSLKLNSNKSAQYFDE